MESGASRAGRLLEREGALGRLRLRLEAARHGESSLLLVQGTAGVGKSTLLQAAADEARARGWQVLGARGDDLERDFPFGVTIQLFAGPVLARAAAEPELLAGAAALARPLLEHAAPAARPDDPDPGFPLLHGLHWLTVNLAEREPLLLCIDDVQWADAPTLRYLHYLRQRAEGLPLAILLARRSGDELAAGGVEPLAHLEGDASAEILELGPLGRDSVRQLVSARVPGSDAVFADACLEATGGNPFLLGELLQAALHEGVTHASGLRGLRPDSVRRSVIVRLARLGEAASALARAAALLGEAPLELVAALAGLDGEATAAAADRLGAAGILDGREPVGFVHPLLRTAVYEGIAATSRRRQHGTAARLLHERGGDAMAVASHLTLSDVLGEPWVVPTLRQAAGVALGRGAAATALAQLRRALAEPGHERDPQLLVALGAAEAAAGDPAWEQHLTAAARAVSDPETRRMALAALGYGRWLQGDPAGAVTAVRGALDEILPGTGGPSEAELLRTFYLAGRFDPTLVPAVHTQLAVVRLGPDGALTPAEVSRLSLAAFDAVLEGRPAVAVELALSVHDGLRDDPVLAARVSPSVWIVAGIALALAGRYGEAERAIAPVVAQAQQTGNRLLLAAALEQRIYARYESGDLRGGLADSQTSLAVSDGWEAAATLTRGLHALLLLERGDVAGAVATFGPSELIDANVRPGTHAHFWVPRFRARLALARGDWAEALAQARLLGELAEAIGVRSPEYHPWRSLAARAAHALGQPEGALALAAEEVALARAMGSARAAGVALTVLGTIQVGAKGVESLREAVALLDTTESRLRQVQARLALGSALRRAGQRREARSVLSQTLQRARAMGALATAETALAELRVAGGRPRRVEPIGMESLTPSQLRVAELAAAGHSNKEIAQALFVTLRTVETHLTEAYRRLRIGSREDLADALRTEPADPGGADDR